MSIGAFDASWQLVAGMFDEQYGKEFVYRRATTQATITAVMGAHEIEANEEQGIYESWHGHIFQTKRAELVLDGIAIEPMPGDEIIETDAEGNEMVYEVRNVPKGRCFEPLDAEEFDLNIYTLKKRTDSA